VVDAAGKPIKDIEVRAYQYGERLEKTFRTNARGQFSDER
jgi:hypothetical protein